MEISTKQLATQIEHLTEYLESDDESIQIRINQLKNSVRAAIYLCEQGDELKARFQLDMLEGELNDLIRVASLRDTLPPTEN